MTPGVWIARPGSRVRHWLNFERHHRVWEELADGRVRWKGACSMSTIIVSDRDSAPHVADADMRRYRPCVACMRVLGYKADYLAEVLEAAEADLAASQASTVKV